jgi:pimeloyl-ACP methyl ester carboxylesterase
MNEQPQAKGVKATHALPAMGFSGDTWDFWVDAWQRNVLYLDAMSQRSARYIEHQAKAAPHVLKFRCDLVMDGRQLPRPVNYVLVRIAPPTGMTIDENKRPFVVVDPRAGHGPGIGGFKPESEIGVALKAGHPCYFIGFLPEPVNGQTIEDVAHAEAAFLERVIALHPDAEGKPAVIGNCQAGWAVMLLAALRPELFGPIVVAGSPLAYWAGVHGENPMRYTGGLLGGSWLTAMMGDLGNGKFDGAWLVSNFENLNPANTLWSKQYNLYSNVDKEVPRYLEFEQWWGGHALLNAEEMQFIADELFIGNKLAAGEMTMTDGSRVDLRNIKSPIVIFCSKADNITPPPQALDWILDLYDSVDEIRAYGQTIVYTVHPSIGHLGIFVSGSVAKKEHDQFASNIDLIDILPPGLYEAVLTPKDLQDPVADLVSGDYLVRFEARTVNDIRAFGGNDPKDDLEFAAVARISEINLGLYRTFVQPWIRLWANDSFAEWMRKSHPLRLQYEMFSPANPLMKTLESVAKQVRDDRKAVAGDNALWQAQQAYSEWVKTSLNAYRDMRDHASEAVFHAVYGSQLLQALVGLKASEASARRRPGKDAAHTALIRKRIEELKDNVAEGGPREAVIRALVYIRTPEGVADERNFNFVRQLRQEAGKGLTLDEFKRTLREQFYVLLLDERRALQEIPRMLAKNPELAEGLVGVLRRMIDLVGLKSDKAKARLAEIENMFESGLHGATEETVEPSSLHLTKERPARTQAARSAKH